MGNVVRITEADLRSAMRDPRYWREGHPERATFASWVTRGWEALHPSDGSRAGGSVWVRAYVREGRPVAAHWRTAPAGGSGPFLLAQDRGSVPPHYGQRLPGPQDLVGRLGAPIKIRPGTNPPETIRDRRYSGHSLDSMQGRGLTPTTVEAAVRPENLVRASRGAHIYWDPASRVMVVVDPRTNVVITAMLRHARPRR